MCENIAAIADGATTATLEATEEEEEEEDNEDGKGEEEPADDEGEEEEEKRCGQRPRTYSRWRRANAGSESVLCLAPSDGRFADRFASSFFLNPWLFLSLFLLSEGYLRVCGNSPLDMVCVSP
jgi:hypothetical protein